MKYSKYRNTGRQRHHACPHMTYTEAQSLDEALDIIASRKTYRSRPRRNNDNFAEREFAAKKLVTLPTVKWLSDALESK